MILEMDPLYFPSNLLYAPYSEMIIRPKLLDERIMVKSYQALLQVVEVSKTKKIIQHFLQEVEDAQRIRRTVIDCFEKAVLPDLSEEERRTNLHFIIVGGGPTGVEFAAELHDFVREDLIKLYPSVKDLVKISVIQSGDHILNT